jgi:hypothetical protein
MTTATVLIQAAYREGNLLAAGASPTSAELTEALPALQRVVDGIFGFEMGEELTDWLVPAPQRTAPVASRYPQGPLVWNLNQPCSGNIWPYPPTNQRIVFGSVTNTVYFPEAPLDGSRMGLVQGSGLGDMGTPGTASGVLTQTAVPANNAAVVLGAQTYTWKTTLTGAANEVLIGLTAAASLANLAAAIIAGEGNGLVYGLGTIANVSASATSDSATGTLTATALQSGVGGNSIVSTTNDVNGSWTGATLSGGVVGAIITLNGNGRLINGAGTQQYATPVAGMEWLYRSDLGNWVPVQMLTITDQCPFPAKFDDFFISVLMKRLAPRYNKIVSNETQAVALAMLDKIRAQYRQAALTTYGSENFPRTDNSYLGGSWWWSLAAAVCSSAVILQILAGAQHAITATA